MRTLFALTIFALFFGTAHAQTMSPLTTLVPCGYQQIASFSTVQTLTLPSTTACGGYPAKFALIQTETESVRWRDDGTAPTASVGQLLATGVLLWYQGTLSKIEFIPSSSSATLDVSYYR